MILSKIYRTLVGYRTRYTYWGCSDVAHKIQQVHGMPTKPNAATSKEWRKWREAAEKASPVGYWITEEGLDYIQNVVLFIPDVYRNVYSKLHNIFISKSHVMKTNLPMGEWSECNMRIESGLFTTLTDFVEYQKANHQDYVAEWSMDPQNTDPHERVEIIKDRRVSGLMYLDWEIALGEESLHQAETAKEIKEIYLWIKDVKDNRPDPHKESGWSDYCDDKCGEGFELLDSEDETEEQRTQVRVMLDAMHEMEEQQNSEDTDMLVRIVKIRAGMWT